MSKLALETALQRKFWSVIDNSCTYEEASFVPRPAYNEMKAERDGLQNPVEGIKEGRKDGGNEGRGVSYRCRR